MKHDTAILGAGALLGLIVGTAAVQEQTLIALVAVCAAAIIFGSRPILLIGLVVLIDENSPGSPYFERSPSVLTAGWQLYERRTAGFSPAFALLVVTGVAIAIRMVVSRHKPHLARAREGDAAVAILIGLSALAGTMSLLQEDGAITPRTAVHLLDNAIIAALPWLTVLLAYEVCVHELRTPDFPRKLARMLAAALIAKGLLGLGVLVVHGGATVDAQNHVIFYDAALPAVAASCLLGYLLAPASRRARLWCVASSASIVVLSFRRAIWLALVAGFLLLPLARNRTYVLARVVGVMAVGAIIVAVLPAGVRSTAFGRVGAAVSVVETGRGESSAKAHESDVKLGLQAAKEHPIAGLGVRATQLKTLVFQDAPALYVHNDFLQTWLRYGLAGLLGLLLLLAVAGHRAWRVLSGTESLSALSAAAAAFCLTVAVPLMTAPFLTKTWRWPMFLGFALAAVRVELQRRGPAADTAVVEEGVPVLARAGARL